MCSCWRWCCILSNEKLKEFRVSKRLQMSFNLVICHLLPLLFHSSSLTSINNNPLTLGKLTDQAKKQIRIFIELKLLNSHLDLATSSRLRPHLSLVSRSTLGWATSSRRESTLRRFIAYITGASPKLFF